MVGSLLLAVIGLGHVLPMAPVSGSMEWEELPIMQKLPGYHPYLRFNPTVQILGFNPSSIFMFSTPNYTAEGHYQVQNGHYFFKPETAMMVGNREVNMLVDDLDPYTKSKQHKMYAESLQTFTADYYEATNILRLTYPVEGRLKTFELHIFTEGDNLLTPAMTQEEQSMAGLWHAPEPYPDKMDCQTRYKIGGLEGLADFTKEAKASEGATFTLLDLRVDKSFRIHGSIGTWRRRGSILWLKDGPSETPLNISNDGMKLLAGGKAVFVRN